MGCFFALFVCGGTHSLAAPDTQVQVIDIAAQSSSLDSAGVWILLVAALVILMAGRVGYLSYCQF